MPLNTSPTSDEQTAERLFAVAERMRRAEDHLRSLASLTLAQTVQGHPASDEASEVASLAESIASTLEEITRSAFAIVG